MKINEIFYSIQGEGPLIGMPTTFIRTTGCNLRCLWCDTKYAYESGKEMSVEEILKEVRKFPTKFVCITGGEPLIQPEIKFLIGRLLKSGYSISIETNGSVSIRALRYISKAVKKCWRDNSQLTVSMDIKCPSSKMHRKMLFSNIKILRGSKGGNILDTLKFVIQDETDYKYAKNIIFKYNPKAQIVFQPVSGESSPKLIESMLKKLKWLTEKVLQDNFKKHHIQVLPQLHKFILTP
ncbi:MAG: radical SAM protein [Elusimicrobiota bacterium]|nr:radical SAM protein [Elusimicrobiota bacterium]